MIVSMLTFELFAVIFLSETYDVIPVWLKISVMAIWFIAYTVAYASEDNLRDKVKSLEDEVKNLKKGGAE